jgi:hypothetical protein
MVAQPDRGARRPLARGVGEHGGGPSLNSRSTTLWNGEVGYRVSSKAHLVVELFNIFDN